MAETNGMEEPNQYLPLQQLSPLVEPELEDAAEQPYPTRPDGKAGAKNRTWRTLAAIAITLAILTFCSLGVVVYTGLVVDILRVLLMKSA